jgi:hypothetical protein
MKVGCIGEMALAKHLRIDWGHTQYNKNAYAKFKDIHGLSDAQYNLLMRQEANPTFLAEQGDIGTYYTAGKADDAAGALGGHAALRFVDRFDRMDGGFGVRRDPAPGGEGMDVVGRDPTLVQPGKPGGRFLPPFVAVGIDHRPA